jgi:toxin CcdB
MLLTGTVAPVKTSIWLINMQHPVANALNRSLAIPATGLHQFDVPLPAKICPVVNIADQRCIALTHMMAGISLKEMGNPVQDLQACSSVLRDAVDFLLNGY